MKPGTTPTWTSRRDLPYEKLQEPMWCFGQADYKSVFAALHIESTQVMSNGHAFSMGERTASEDAENISAQIHTQISASEMPQGSDFGFVTVHILIESLGGELIFGGHKSLVIRGGFSTQVFG